MAEEPGFFRFALDRGGVLIPSEGFSLATLGPDQSAGRRIIGIDALFRVFFPDIQASPASASPSLIYRHEGNGKPLDRIAFLVDRDFEVITLPLAAFSLPPPSLRMALRNKGLVALRFLHGSGMDLLVDPDRAVKAFSLAASPC